MIKITHAAEVPQAPLYVIADHSTVVRTKMHITPALTATEADYLRHREIELKGAHNVGISRIVPPIHPDKIEWSMPTHSLFYHEYVNKLPLPVRKKVRD